MKCAEVVRSSWKGDVDLGESARLLLRTKLLRAGFDGGGHGVANFVEQLADDWLLFLRERFHLLAPRGNAAAAPEIFHARGFERLLVSRGFDLAQRFVAQLFEWVSH